MKTKILLSSKFIVLVLFCISKSNAFAQKRIGISGDFQGDNAFTVEGFSDLSSTNLEQTSFLITNKTADEVDFSFEIAVTYTCNRVKKDKTKSITLKGYESYHTGNFLNSTSDKNCINTNTDGTKTSIVGISYLGLVNKNISADKRKHKKEFDSYIANVEKYYNTKNYNKATEEAAKAAQIAYEAEEGQLTREWGIKIQEAKDKEAYENANRSSGKNPSESGADANKSQKPNDDFWNDKPSSNNSNSKTETEKKVREDKEYTDKINQIMQEGERKRQENQQKMDIWQNNFNTTFYALQNSQSMRSNVEENSHLSGNFSSVEELEREFNEKYNTLNNSIDEWKDASNEAIRQGSNLAFNDGSASGQAIGDFVGTAISLFNNGEKEKRERKEQLEKERQRHLADLKAKKKAAITEIRKKLLSEFPDGGTPLSRHNIKQPEVYCFAYYFNHGNIGVDNPEIYITNVFPVAQYSDGTWPFKNSLVNEMKNKTKASQITLMGYYTQKDLADQMRQSLINLSGKAEMKATGLEYKGKATDTTYKASSEDFWETKKSEPKEETTKTNSNDFWNN